MFRNSKKKKVSLQAFFFSVKKVLVENQVFLSPYHTFHQAHVETGILFLQEKKNWFAFRQQPKLSAM